MVSRTLHTPLYMKKSQRHLLPKMKRGRLDRQKTSTMALLRLRLSVVYTLSHITIATGRWMFELVTELTKMANGSI